MVSAISVSHNRQYHNITVETPYVLWIPWDLVKCPVYRGVLISGVSSCIQRKHIWDIAKCLQYKSVLISGVSFKRVSTVYMVLFSSERLQPMPILPSAKKTLYMCCSEFPNLPAVIIPALIRGATFDSCRCLSSGSAQFRREGGMYQNGTLVYSGSCVNSME